MAGSQDDLAEKSMMSVFDLPEFQVGRDGKYVADAKILVGGVEYITELKHSPETRSEVSTSRDFTPFKVREHLFGTEIWGFGQCFGSRLDRSNPDAGWKKFVFVPTKSLMPLYVDTVLKPFFEGKDAAYLKNPSASAKYGPDGAPAGAIQRNAAGHRVVGLLGWNESEKLAKDLIEKGYDENFIRKLRRTVFRGIGANDPPWSWVKILELEGVLVLDPNVDDPATLRAKLRAWAKTTLEKIGPVEGWLPSWIEANPEYDIMQDFYDYEIEQDKDKLRESNPQLDLFPKAA